MQGSLDQPPIVVRGSRGRAIWLVLGSAMFVAMGLLILRTGASPIVATLCIGFFGLCGAAGVAILIAPARLEIGPSGITQKVLWRTLELAWTDVYNFRPAVIGLSNTVVGFDYLTERPKRGGLRGLNTALAGVQGALNPGMEIAPVKLADLLNEARERWIGGSAGAPAIAAAATLPASSFSIAGVAGARLNRKVYWIAAGSIFAVVVAMSFVPGLQRVVSSVTAVLFIRVFAGRLHDLGRSGWWQLAVYGVQIVMALAAAVARVPLAVILGLIVLIHAVFVIVLGLIPGQRDANKYGPPPNQPSPLAVSEAFR